MKLLLIVPAFTVLLFQQCKSDVPSKDGSDKIDHSLWTALLEKYVNDEGLVNYRGFIRDSVQLNAYLRRLTESSPDDINWSEKERLAYWINAYNAFTVKLIVDHYPLASIKDIGSAIQIPFVNSPWDIKFIEIEGKKLDLNNIEHSILRKEFDEPRIHFAINCASFSCPTLRKEAYSAEKLDAQLNEQAVTFINDLLRNDIKSNQAELSRIFSWFKGDFTKNGSLKEYINQYSRTKMDDDTKISFRKYDWSLNDLSQNSLP